MAQQSSNHEVELLEQLNQGEISKKEYINRHSEEMQHDFEDFCNQKDLQQTEESADQFMEYLLVQEQQAHTDLLD